MATLSVIILRGCGFAVSVVSQNAKGVGGPLQTARLKLNALFVALFRLLRDVW